MEPLLYADFQNLDPDGRIRLNTAGTLEDLARLRLTLTDGLSVTLYTDDDDSDAGLLIPATIEFNTSEAIWSAVVDWSQLIRAGHDATAERFTPVLAR